MNLQINVLYSNFLFPELFLLIPAYLKDIFKTMYVPQKTIPNNLEL